MDVRRQSVARFLLGLVLGFLVIGTAGSQDFSGGFPAGNQGQFSRSDLNRAPVSPSTGSATGSQFPSGGTVGSNSPGVMTGESTFRPPTANDAPFATPESNTIQWVNGKHLDAALRQAAATNKPILLHFWNERCRPCMELEQFVFPNPVLAQTINDNFIPVKVNTMETPQIHRKYGVNRWPWDVFLAPSGAKLLDRPSPSTVTRYIDQVKTASRLHDNFLKYTASQTTQLNQQHARSTSNAPTTFDQKSAFEQNTAASTPPFVSTSGGQADRSAASGFAVRPQGSTRAEPPQVTGTSNSSTIHFQPKSGPSRVVNEFFKQKPQGSSAAATNSGGPAAPSAGTVPAGPTLGMEGYCPVSMLRERRKVRGDRKWGCIHRGKVYFFVNESYRDIFMKDPDRYAPVLGGYDVVIYRETGKLVEGKTVHGGFLGTGDNKVIFLFANEENKQKFKFDREGQYIQAARMATRNAGENWLR